MVKAGESLGVPGWLVRHIARTWCQDASELEPQAGRVRLEPGDLPP